MRLAGCRCGHRDVIGYTGEGAQRVIICWIAAACILSYKRCWMTIEIRGADSLPICLPTTISLIRLALVATPSRVKKVAYIYMCSCIDALTGERLSVRVYKKKEFVQLASILLTSCPGVNSPLHVISSDDEVITACKKTYGDLHEFLKSKKMLTEAQAAPLFRQIVDLVKHAHFIYALSSLDLVAEKSLRLGNSSQPL